MVNVLLVVVKSQILVEKVMATVLEFYHSISYLYSFCPILFLLSCSGDEITIIVSYVTFFVGLFLTIVFMLPFFFTKSEFYISLSFYFTLFNCVILFSIIYYFIFPKFFLCIYSFILLFFLYFCFLFFSFLFFSFFN